MTMNPATSCCQALSSAWEIIRVVAGNTQTAYHALSLRRILLSLRVLRAASISGYDGVRGLDRAFCPIDYCKVHGSPPCRACQLHGSVAKISAFVASRSWIGGE